MLALGLDFMLYRKSLQNKFIITPLYTQNDSFAYMAPRELATVACCIACDSWFVVVVGAMDVNAFKDTVRQRSKTSRKKAEEALFDHLDALQRSLVETTKVRTLVCPTCVEVCAPRVKGVPPPQWQQLIEDPQSYLPLSPCIFWSFEKSEPPPLYTDVNNISAGLPSYALPKKPKWGTLQWSWSVNLGNGSFEVSENLQALVARFWCNVQDS